MKTIRKVLCFIVVVAMIVTLVPNTVTAATKVRLNKKKVTLTITDKKKNPTTTLKVKGVSNKVAKKAKWSSSKKSVAIVKKGKVTAKKAGTTTITCKVKGKKYTCKVTVADKRTPIDSAALNVTIKSLNLDMTNPDNLKYVQYWGPQGFVFPPSNKEDPTSPYTEEHLNIYKNSRQIFFCNGTPYVVNSQIVVTYNGEDVINKASYELQLEDGIGAILGANDVKNGIFDPDTVCLISAYKNPKLIVKYKGEEKTISLKQTITEKILEMCYCGFLYDTREGGDNHNKYCQELRAEAKRNNDWERWNYLFELHGGYWGIGYKLVDIQAK